MVSSNYDKVMENLKKDRTSFTKVAINFQEVMNDICVDINKYARATLTGDKIDVLIGDNDPDELYHRVSKSISNNLECPTYAVFMFNVVVRGDKISIIKKNSKNDELD